jgi:hypothetical protein
VTTLESGDTDPLTDEELAGIRERVERAVQAAPGPYRLHYVPENGQYYVQSLNTWMYGRSWVSIANCYATRAEAEFVLHAHEDVPRLLTELGRLRALLTAHGHERTAQDGSQ